MSLACQIFLQIFVFSIQGKVAWVSTGDLGASVRVEEARAQLSLAGSLKISVTVLLFIGAAPANDIVWGTLGQDINLDIPGFQMINIDDIHWEKGKKKVVRFQISNKPKNPDEKYNVSVNGTLKIKHLMLEDSDTYKVVIYDKDGKNALEKTFQLKIQGKSLFSKFLHLSMGAV